MGRGFRTVEDALSDLKRDRMIYIKIPAYTRIKFYADGTVRFIRFLVPGLEMVTWSFSGRRTVRKYLSIPTGKRVYRFYRGRPDDVEIRRTIDESVKAEVAENHAAADTENGKGIRNLGENALTNLYMI